FPAPICFPVGLAHPRSPYVYWTGGAPSGRGIIVFCFIHRNYWAVNQASCFMDRLLGNIGSSAGHDVTTAMTGLTRTTRHELRRYESATERRVSRRGACHTETERRHGGAVRVAEPPHPRLHPCLQLPPDVYRHPRDASRGGRQDPRGDHRQCPAPPPACGEHAASARGSRGRRPGVLPDGAEPGGAVSRADLRRPD